MDSEIQVTEHVFQEEGGVLGTNTSDLRRHLTIVKRIGILLMLILCTCTFGVVISRAGDRRLPIDYEVKADYIDPNHTSCVYFEKYTFRENEYAVCNVDGVVYININVNGSGTLFDIRRWLAFKQMVPLVDTSITKANI
jgi:hypothetical protein